MRWRCLARRVLQIPDSCWIARCNFFLAGKLRHRDHRFEWARGEFRAWADRVAAAHGYTVRYLPVGADDPEVGPPTQMAVFSKKHPAAGAPA